MMGWKVAGGILVLSLLTTGWLKLSLSQAETTIAVQQTEIQQYKTNQDRLEQAVKTEKETVKRLIDINDKTGERLYVLSNNVQASYMENAELNNQINDLRQVEATLALEKPYLRGVEAGKRINHLMNRISGSNTMPDIKGINPLMSDIKGIKGNVKESSDD